MRWWKMLRSQHGDNPNNHPTPEQKREVQERRRVRARLRMLESEVARFER